jgi:hypothetical protein
MKNVKFGLFLFIGLLLSACEPTNCTEYSQSKTKLGTEVPANELPQFAFERTETDEAVQSSLTRKTDANATKWDKQKLKEGVPTGWFTATDKKTGKEQTFRSVFAETDTAFVLNILGAEKSVTESLVYKKYNVPRDTSIVDPIDPETDEDCWAYYEEHHFPQLRALANKLCHPIRYCVGCPRHNPSVYYMIAFYPTSPKCKIVRHFPYDKAEQTIPSIVARSVQ